MRICTTRHSPKMSSPNWLLTRIIRHLTVIAFGYADCQLQVMDRSEARKPFYFHEFVWLSLCRKETDSSNETGFPNFIFRSNNTQSRGQPSNTAFQLNGHKVIRL